MTEILGFNNLLTIHTKSLFILKLPNQSIHIPDIFLHRVMGPKFRGSDGQSMTKWVLVQIKASNRYRSADFICTFRCDLPSFQ